MLNIINRFEIKEPCLCFDFFTECKHFIKSTSGNISNIGYPVGLDNTFFVCDWILDNIGDSRLMFTLEDLDLPAPSTRGFCDVCRLMFGSYDRHGRKIILREVQDKYLPQFITYGYVSCRSTKNMVSVHAGLCEHIGLVLH